MLGRNLPKANKRPGGRQGSPPMPASSGRLERQQAPESRIILIRCFGRRSPGQRDVGRLDPGASCFRPHRHVANLCAPPQDANYLSVLSAVGPSDVHQVQRHNHGGGSFMYAAGGYGEPAVRRAKAALARRPRLHPIPRGAPQRTTAETAMGGRRSAEQKSAPRSDRTW